MAAFGSAETEINAHVCVQHYDVTLTGMLREWGKFRQQGICNKRRRSNVGEQTKHRRHTNMRTNCYQYGENKTHVRRAGR